jgi:hypothetical protein
MTTQELIHKLQQLPPDSHVEFECNIAVARGEYEDFYFNKVEFTTNKDENDCDVVHATLK